MSEYNPPSIEACLDKPADAPIPDRRARGMVSSDKMMYWHERAERAELALTKLVDALEHKSSLHPAFVEARALIASGFAPSAEVGGEGGERGEGQ